MDQPRLSRLYLVLLVSAIAIGTYWRVVEVPRALLFGDELHSLPLVVSGYRAIFTTYQNTGAGMALPLMQRLASDVIGFNHWSIRLPALVGGLALLFGIYPLVFRIVGRKAAASAGVLVAMSSPLIFYSHFGRAYALAAFVAFLLAILCHRIATGTPLTWRRASLMAVLLGALPYLHLTTLAFAPAVLAGLVLTLICQRERRRELIPFSVAVIAGGLLAVLLHAPAWGALIDFVNDKTKTEMEYGGRFGPMVFLSALIGSKAGAWTVVVLAVLAMLAFLRRLGSQGLPLVFSCLGPVVALTISRPYGDGFSYARYALPALPCVLLLVAWFLASPQGLASFVPRLRGPLAILPTLLAVLLFSLAPRPWLATTDGPHANTYLRLFDLPAFDEPFPRTPSFFHQLAEMEEPVRLVVAPMLTNRNRQLYRNYYLQHGMPTSFAVSPWELAELPDGPYVSLEDPNWREKADADYLVVHIQIIYEMQQYWEFVFAEQRAPTDPTEALLLESMFLAGSNLLLPPSREPLEALRKELGKPVYKNEFLRVWKLKADSASNEKP